MKYLAPTEIYKNKLYYLINISLYKKLVGTMTLLLISPKELISIEMVVLTSLISQRSSLYLGNVGL